MNRNTLVDALVTLESKIKKYKEVYSLYKSISNKKEKSKYLENAYQIMFYTKDYIKELSTKRIEKIVYQMFK